MTVCRLVRWGGRRRWRSCLALLILVSLMLVGGDRPVYAEEFVWSYTRGGIAFDASAPFTFAYPADLDGSQLLGFADIQVLLAESTDENYRRFVSDYNREVFVYPDAASGSFVVSVHSGTVRSTGRDLEAEPLRRMLEGPVHSPFDLASIEANLAALTGREFLISQGVHTARFAVTQARRMSADDVESYRYRPMELSTFMGPLDAPEMSFLLLVCSGRQPGEPDTSFPGRYVFVLEHVPGSAGSPPGDNVHIIQGNSRPTPTVAAPPTIAPEPILAQPIDLIGNGTLFVN